jgi:hypothetical protein
MTREELYAAVGVPCDPMRNGIDIAIWHLKRLERRYPLHPSQRDRVRYCIQTLVAAALGMLPEPPEKSFDP